MTRPGALLCGKAEHDSAMGDQSFLFGPFELIPARRLLLEDGKPLRLGARALDVLVMLVERAGETVPKNELMAGVWPAMAVEENALRVHVAALRRALGERPSGEGYVTNIPGRGYRFIAPVTPSQNKEAAGPSPDQASRRDNLPATLSEVVGRAEVVDSLAFQLRHHRLLSVVGPGGIGKTTVAISVAEGLNGVYPDGIWFVALAPLANPDLVPSALSMTLGMALSGADPISQLGEWFRTKHALIILDSCEHVIGCVAVLAEAILRAAPQVSILATSREPLRAEGEWVHRLAPLDLPPASDHPASSEALGYAAVQLFSQRVQATVAEFAVDAGNVGAVLEICRRLDGLPLALELAAARVSAFGVNGLAARLDDRFALLTKGRRTALPRQQTLRATMDWSYELLAETEQIVLRRLSVLRGNFRIEAAAAVAGDERITADSVCESVGNLGTKSLLTADVSGEPTYWMLDTTAAYALEKLNQSGEATQIRRRHAAYYRDLFKRAETEWETRPAAEWLADYGQQIDNARAALDWSYSPDADAETGVALAAAAVPVWLQMSLVEECRARAVQALAHLADMADADPGLEMKLTAALGGALLFTRGPMPETAEAWRKALEIAERLGDSAYISKALWGLWVYHMNRGEFGAALLLARKFYAIVTDRSGSADFAVADRMIGISLHYRGDQADARRHIERMLTRFADPVGRSPSIRYLYDQKVVAHVALARILWLQGFPDQALRMAQSTVADACALNQPVTICFSLAEVGCPIAFFTGDIALAERYTSLLLEHSAAHWLPVWQSWAKRFKGTLLIRQGDVAAGVELLRNSLDQMPEASFQPRFTWFLGQLAGGLSRIGQPGQGLQAIDEALARSERNEDRWCLAELLRIKGELLRLNKADDGVVEGFFIQSMDWARRQEAVSWQLRAAADLARLWRSQDRVAEARGLLGDVFARFTEGFTTLDLREAKSLLDALGR